MIHSASASCLCGGLGQRTSSTSQAMSSLARQCPACPFTLEDMVNGGKADTVEDDVIVSSFRHPWVPLCIPSATQKKSVLVSENVFRVLQKG